MPTLTRRDLLVTGGAGAGLAVAWALWPRDYRPNLVANPGERVFDAWLKVGIDGHVAVAVPQLEEGQGSWTGLAQIVADELGADWRTVGIEPAPLNPLYANPLALAELFDGTFARIADGMQATLAARKTLMLTGGSTSVRMFEPACRAAGAGARALLCKAAARRWGVGWTECAVDAGFVVHGRERLRFADLADAAVAETLPSPLPIGVGGAGKLMGKAVPRLDAPAKVDGSATFAGDVRLPDQVHAAIRQGPAGTRLTRVDRAAADRIRGVLQVVENPRWVAAVATTWWAAERALDALAPRFEGPSPGATTAGIDAALAAALARPGIRMAGTGDPAVMPAGARPIAADYGAALGVHASVETTSATAAWRDGRLELWLPTAAPAQSRAAAAAAAGLAEQAVTVHPMPAGGSFGARLEPLAAEQAAVLAMMLKRPVSLVWSRGEETLHDRYRPPARARMTARLAGNGAILGWHAAIAAPATGRELARRIVPGIATDAATLGVRGDRYAVAGALPPYRLPAVAVDHHPAGIGVETGHLRGGAHGYTCFFTESFMDELARAAGMEPISYRIGMLGPTPRLARCLSAVAAIGGWNGGGDGSGQGVAAHAFRGSHVAVLAEAHLGDDGRPAVDRLVAAVDCGRVVNPDLVRQQIEGGLLFGMAQAMGATTGFAGGLAEARGYAALDLPLLDDTPDIIVELVPSDEAPGGISELGVPAVAPAIANAIRSATGFRPRHLPLRGRA